MPEIFFIGGKFQEGLCAALMEHGTGQWFASGFLQTTSHDDTLAIGCTLPTAGRVWDFHPLERVPAGHTKKTRLHNTAGQVKNVI